MMICLSQKMIKVNWTILILMLIIRIIRNMMSIIMVLMLKWKIVMSWIGLSKNKKKLTS